MDHFRECFDRQVAATDELLRNFLTGPAPKEEEMTIHTGGVRTDAELPPHIIGQSPILDGQPRVDGKLFAARTAERRALAHDAYMAALGGYCAAGNAENEYTVAAFAQEAALETVRRWDAFMAAVDAEGGE